MMNPMKRKVFFLSDSTGMTAENLGKSLLAQFSQIQFESVTKPFVDTPEKAARIAREINQEAQTVSERPIVIDTIVKAHGGEVSLSSKPGKTVFTVTLPTR